MLKRIEIKNFAVIRKIAVEFDQGLNVITGETGSGKSIIINALGLLMGNRSSASYVRSGERMASVEGVFEINRPLKKEIEGILAEANITLEKTSSGICVRREVSTTGKNRTFIDDEMVNAATLQLLQPQLMDIFGQGDQRTLLSKHFQLALLDGFARCEEEVKRVAVIFRRWRAAASALEAHRKELSEAKRLEDYLQYQLAEIMAAEVTAGEDEELLAEKQLLVHAERISQLGSSAYDDLYESDESALSKLASVRRRLEQLSELDTGASIALDALQSSMNSLTEIASLLRTRREGVAAARSTHRLTEIEQRLSELERLKRKYNVSLQGLVELQRDFTQKLSSLASGAESERELSVQAEKAAEEYLSAAQSLSDKRRKAAPLLAERVTKELADVALQNSEFDVLIETLPAESTASFTAEGIDSVEFILTANPGEPQQPLAKVASGGELSRIMLVLRTISMESQQSAEQSETLVFDEIDSGIGGRAAEAVGRRLKALARRKQVICVTHQSQIARFADQHYVVSKSVNNGRTSAAVFRMEMEGRVMELARMIGGNTVETATLEAARGLLENAANAVAHRQNANALRRTIRRAKSN